MLIAEGADGLLSISDRTSPVDWTIAIAAGATFLAVALSRRRRA